MARGINNQTRYRAFLVLKNLPAIEEWRATLTQAKRDKFNHPGAVWFAWKRATAAVSKKQEPKPSPDLDREAIRERIATARGRKRHAIFWPQDALRRAHAAMLQSRSTDLLTLARVALQASVRSEDDLLALLPEPSPHRENKSETAAHVAAA
jgi:hypothetical protein